MSERFRPHNGRDKSGHYKVRQTDVDDVRADQQGEEFIRDDVRLGGAVADTGSNAGQRGREIARLVEENRDQVEQLAEGAPVERSEPS